MLRKLYDWMMKTAASPRAVPALAAVSFVESSVFPLPPDIMLVPMCLANRKKAFWFACVCTLASVAGALLGYAIGHFAYETAGRAILSLYGGGDKWFAEFQHQFSVMGFWLVMMAGFTPFPFKVITIMSGVAGLDIPTLLMASFISRGGRFFLEAILIYFFGEQVRGIIEKNFEVISIVFFVVLVGGFFLIKYVF